MPLQTEILSTVTSDFLKQIVVFKLFNSVLIMRWMKHVCVNVPENVLRLCDFFSENMPTFARLLSSQRIDWIIQNFVHTLFSQSFVSDISIFCQVNTIIVLI